MATDTAKYTQTDRPIKISTPLGEDAVLLEQFVGAEVLSAPFQFDLDLLALKTKPVVFKDLLGQSVTVTMALAGEGQTRHFNGIVCRLVQGPEVTNPRGSVDFIRYRAVMVPKLWLLSRQARSRTFQHVNVPTILTDVLGSYSIALDNRIQGTFEPRDYCVQYRETDFAFLSRLMEEEGIYYYFTHSDGAHKMVLANTPQGHADVPGQAAVKFRPRYEDPDEEDHIVSWEKAQEIRATKYTLWDHNFELPDKNLEASQATLATVPAGTVAHPLKVGVNDAYEIYDYPGAYAGRFDGVAKGGGDQPAELQKIFTDNARTAAIRMQEEAAATVAFTGTGRCRQFSAGCKFTLQDHFDADGSYVLTRVDHDARLEGAYVLGKAPRYLYSNRFSGLPAALPYRPARTTPRPFVRGHQTALVVGPQNQEIFTDKYGRVKVQFFWDREGAKNADSSCWVRVGSIWAGKGWGAYHIPRIGQEVIVAFLEGDPDQPIIVGSVYNAENMPPYTLPDNMTRSGIKSRSSAGGDEKTFNELYFEDKKGEEQVYFHAEKNFDRVVENNDTLKVGFEKKDKGDQTIQVFNNQALTVGAGEKDAADGSQAVTIFNTQTLTVGSGEASAKDGSQTISVYKDRTTTIKTGNETLTVRQGNRTVNVDQGNDTHNVKAGNRAVNVDQGNDTHDIKVGNREVNVNGNDSLTIKTGNQKITLNAGKCTITAAQGIELVAGSNSIKIDPIAGITLTVGGSSVKLSPTGVTVTGTMVKVEGTALTQIKAPISQLNASGMMLIKGGITMIN